MAFTVIPESMKNPDGIENYYFFKYFFLKD